MNIISLLKNKIALGGLCAVLLIGVTCFYFLGPTEKHVESLASNQNSEGLVKLIQERADSDYFASTTQKATAALIDLSEKQYTDSVNAIGNVLISDSTKIVQKKAIIEAFNKKGMIVPDFYKAYEINSELRDELKRNAIDKNPNIFKEKLLLEFNSIREQSKTDFSDYTEKVQNVKIWNINGFANDIAFANLLAFTKLYAVQKYVKDKDDEKTLNYLRDILKHRDSNFIIKNERYLDVITTCLNSKLETKSELHRVNDQMDRMRYEEEIDIINRNIAEVEKTLGSYRKYLLSFLDIDNDRVILTGLDPFGNAIVVHLVNPDYWNFSKNAYEEYFEKLGEFSFYYRRAHTLRKVNIIPLKQRLQMFQQQKREIEIKKQNMENEINQLMRKLEENGTMANSLLNQMLNCMNKISIEELLAFSKDDSKVRIIK